MAERVERVSDLPPCKRHITTHDAKGKSVYTKSSPQQYMPVGDSGGMARSYAVASIPATLTDDADIKAYLGQDAVTSWYQPSIVTPNGANLLVVDLAPGATSTMHQTVSIDFSICTIGEIEHELDSGETVLLRPGVRPSL